MSQIGGQNTILGQVFGASTVASGIAMLPDTGDNLINNILSILAIVLGSLCLFSFIFTRILKKILG